MCPQGLHSSALPHVGSQRFRTLNLHRLHPAKNTRTFSDLYWTEWTIQLNGFYFMFEANGNEGYRRDSKGHIRPAPVSSGQLQTAPDSSGYIGTGIYVVTMFARHSVAGAQWHCKY